MNTDDLVNALGAAAGEMAKKYCAEVLGEIALRKIRRGAKIRREVTRLEELIQAANADFSGGDVEGALDRLFREVSSWDEDDDDWSDSQEVQDLQESVVDILGVLMGRDEDESGEED